MSICRGQMSPQSSSSNKSISEDNIHRSKVLANAPLYMQSTWGQRPRKDPPVGKTQHSISCKSGGHAGAACRCSLSLVLCRHALNWLWNSWNWLLNQVNENWTFTLAEICWVANLPRARRPRPTAPWQPSHQNHLSSGTSLSWYSAPVQRMDHLGKQDIQIYAPVFR